MESTAVDNVVYTGNTGIFKVHTRLRVQQYILLSTTYLNKLYKHVRWRVHRRWRVQQSATLCTLKTTECLKYIRGCVYNSIFSYVPAELYKLYNRRIHSRRTVHKRWRVQQSTTLCTQVTTEYLKYIRDCVYNSIFYYFPVDVYNLYTRRIHVRWSIHRRWRVQQSTTLCILVTTE